MPTTLSSDEIVQRGREIYEREIASQIGVGDQGRFLVIDVMTGEHAIADTDVAAAGQVRIKNPSAELYYVRIGSPVAYRLGGSLRLKR